MAITSCPDRIDCRGTEYPISNYSSEADDTLQYIVLALPGQGNPTGPTFGPVRPPNLNSGWTNAYGCLGIGEATSTTAAAQAALAMSASCAGTAAPENAYSNPVPTGNAQSNPPSDSGVGNGPTQIPQGGGRPNAGPRSATYCNKEQKSPCPSCPEGTCPGDYVVPEGKYCARTQQLADYMAMQEAKAKAAENCVCAPDLSGEYCVHDILSGEPQTIYGDFPPFKLVNTGGAKPPGYDFSMVSDTEFVVVGTLDTPGNFQFSPGVMDARGNVAACVSLVNILGISNIDVMDDAHCANPYSFELMGTGGEAPYTIECLNPGELPEGLSVTNGLITGTPTSCGGADLYFRVTDSSTPPRSCEDHGLLMVLGPCAPDLKLQVHGGPVSSECPPEGQPPTNGWYMQYNDGLPAQQVFQDIHLCDPGQDPPTVKVTVDLTLSDVSSTDPLPACYGYTLHPAPSCYIGVHMETYGWVVNETVGSASHWEVTTTVVETEHQSLTLNGTGGTWKAVVSVVEV